MQAPIEETVIPAAPHGGQKIVGVRFMPVGKVYHFDGTHLRDLRSGDWVIVSTTRGRQMGQVASMEPPKHGAADRSEERRVGKECRSRWSPYH